MLPPALPRRAPRPARLAAARYAAALGAPALLAALALHACDDATTAPAPRIAYGPAQPFARGTARTYVTLGADGAPTAVGVALSDSAMHGLPATPMPGMPMALMLHLALPPEARGTGYDHATVDWNPQGHAPDALYGAPHFDFHFYTIPVAEQEAITPADPAYEAKLAKAPPAEFRPATYVPFPGGVPMMGAHWGDPASPELAPGAAAGTFTRTFLYGSYDGHFVFFEPMISKAHLEATRAQAAGAATRPVRLPARYERPGRYPTSYTVAYDAAAREYRVAVDGLVPSGLVPRD